MPSLKGGRGRVQNTDRPQPGVSTPQHRTTEAAVLAGFVVELAAIVEGFSDIAGPDPVRVDLRLLRSKISHMYGLPVLANESELAWENESGEAIPE